MSAAPPPEWREAVGNAAVTAWHYDQIYGDLFIAQAWANPRLRDLPPSEAAALAVAEENANDLAGLAKLMTDKTLSALGIWRMGYIHEWTWLVMGECDFMNDDGDPWLTDLWRERGSEDPAAVARSDYEQVFDAAQHESYRMRREALLWTP